MWYIVLKSVYFLQNVCTITAYSILSAKLHIMAHIFTETFPAFDLDPRKVRITGLGQPHQPQWLLNCMLFGAIYKNSKSFPYSELSAYYCFAPTAAFPGTSSAPECCTPSSTRSLSWTFCPLLHLLLRLLGGTLFLLLSICMYWQLLKWICINFFCMRLEEKYWFYIKYCLSFWKII